jgi:hypothetical protein
MESFPNNKSGKGMDESVKGMKEKSRGRRIWKNGKRHGTQRMRNGMSGYVMSNPPSRRGWKCCGTMQDSW